MAFYTYLWLREDGTPYYVGKASSLRRTYSGRHRVDPPLSERIIVQEWLTEEDAFLGERFLIALYGRLDLKTGCLSNLTDGGEGHLGLKQSAETIHKRVSKTRGRKRSIETRALFSLQKRGKRNPSYEAKGNSHWNRKTHCKRGHMRIPENVDSHRACIECTRRNRHDS